MTEQINQITKEKRGVRSIPEIDLSINYKTPLTKDVNKEDECPIKKLNTNQRLLNVIFSSVNEKSFVIANKVADKFLRQNTYDLKQSSLKEYSEKLNNYRNILISLYCNGETADFNLNNFGEEGYPLHVIKEKLITMLARNKELLRQQEEGTMQKIEGGQDNNDYITKFVQYQENFDENTLKNFHPDNTDNIIAQLFHDIKKISGFDKLQNIENLLVEKRNEKLSDLNELIKQANKKPVLKNMHEVNSKVGEILENLKKDYGLDYSQIYNIPYHISGLDLNDLKELHGMEVIEEIKKILPIINSNISKINEAA